MLFPYIFVPHQMDRMQSFIDFIFYEVWCKAPTNSSFGLNLFDGHADLREVMQSFLSSKAQGAVFFRSYVESIHDLFSKLSTKEINTFKSWYIANNNLERACANDKDAKLIHYTDIFSINKELADQLGRFFKGLYSDSLLDLADLRAKIGNIDDHYKNFITTNDNEKCPFCGINDIKGHYHTKREAYDHYLPKALYPFNSINFLNLAPTCHECNSSYKHTKDPLNNPTGRRKAFNPYTTKKNLIELEVELSHSNIDDLKPDDIKLQFGPTAISEELESWRDVYSIDERYKAKLCGKNSGKYWITQMFDEWPQGHKQPVDFLAKINQQTAKSPFADCNFLKRPFLEAFNARLLSNSA